MKYNQVVGLYHYNMFPCTDYPKRRLPLKNSFLSDQLELVSNYVSTDAKVQFYVLSGLESHTISTCQTRKVTELTDSELESFFNTI